jgi:hypothetical protein
VLELAGRFNWPFLPGRVAIFFCAGACASAVSRPLSRLNASGRARTKAGLGPGGRFHYLPDSPRLPLTTTRSFFRENLVMLRSHFRVAVGRQRLRYLPIAGRFLASQFLAVAIAIGTLSAGGVLADTREPQQVQRQTRNYSISIDGFKRGQSTTQFRSKSGTVWIHSESSIRINYLVYRYNYTSVGTEVWKDGRLAEVENTSDYNGTPYVLKGTPTPRGLQIATNGAESLISPDVWDTSYLFLPDRLNRVDAATVLLFDSDRGHRLVGKVQFVGEETLTIAEGQILCTHYRIGGDVQVDVWFDASRRLVRQESRESGHKVRFELLSVTTE